MASSFGTALRVSIFGQSHSPAIGCVVEGLPSGFVVDQDRLAHFMARRAPGGASWSTPRKEADAVRIVGGLNPEGATCGAPLACLIENTNTRSQDYDELRRIPRPGHADLTAQAKWHGAQDVAGGGHFSGRLTAPLCAAGGIALQMLEERGVRIAAHLDEVAGIEDLHFCARKGNAVQLATQMDILAARPFPTICPDAEERMVAAIEEARAEGDSVGGVIECVATGLPKGLGEPLFDGIESTIARIAFGVPAVKGIEFGAGFEAARLRGSQNNDPYGLDEHGNVVPLKNDAGGNLGGISTGAPIVFRMAVKPTPSIAREQRSVDLVANEEATLAVRGRHDPCIAPRAVPVAEAVMALALLDCWLMSGMPSWQVTMR